ncbi:glutamate ABC transporter substrate-binding protein [Pseudonocardia humida]|uniref:Glutamate ABC transporter substrate-binding protein n=1 Tax=Pseudonocardia humida TaxID=2800819 RepID=A0ABT1A390_9PSEU|nr:glutamate ABC transporter substrate-binding protein [Pseudonocardia humida]MCO1657481.1 glutamate ABC transporter substrate-binding protein [Pseudonocardia humida]
MNRRAGVEVRRPAVYLGLAGILALGAALVPTTPAAAPPPAAAAPAAPSAPAPACDQVVDSLRPQGPLPEPGAMPPGSTMAAIQQRERLIAGVDQTKYLVGYRNPLTGQLEGTDIDIVRRIAQAIFGDPDRVQFIVYDIADRVKAVEEKQVDLVVNNFSVTCARQLSVEFSAPYQLAQQRLLVPKGSGIREVEDLAGGTVCTSAGSTTERELEALPVDMEVVTEVAIPDCVIRMQQGAVEAVSSDDIILAGLAAQDPQTEVVGRVLATAGYGVGMRKDAPDLVRFVNGVLEQGRDDGSLEESFQRWLGPQLDPAPPPEPRYRD